MGILYLAALIVGVGTIAMQLLFSGHGDADADAHLDVDADHGHVGHGDGGFLPIFLSLRFWTFAFLAFGMVGTLLHYFRMTTSPVTIGLAVAMGLVSGLAASLTFRLLSRAEMSSGGSTTDAVGSVGKVLVPVSRRAHGKVRIELKGQTVDLLATTDEDDLEAGDMVLVEEVDSGTARVGRPPPELLPPKR